MTVDLQVSRRRRTERTLDVTAYAAQRLRLATVCAALVTLVFSQSAGNVSADTKLDLLVNPLRLLSRSLTLWDPNAASGQLQNQGYGYLFPIGPFYLIGDKIGLSPWMVQRAWQAALVLAAFLGTVRLTRMLGLPAFWPRVAAGLAYALAPRMLSELGSISSELMPVAALPWVLIPLVAGARSGSPRAAAARSGIALLFAGGVNAAATVAILPVPVIWLLTRTPGPRRRQLMKWWALAVVLACTWWVIPLLLLGRYSPPFLDWIEPSSLTTAVTNLMAGLRGVDHWEGYLGPSVWPAGWILVAAPAAILATTAVAAAGLAGLCRSDLPHPRFLRAVLIVGLILLTAGHVQTLGPAFGPQIRILLDGPLNVFRNIHKFDPVVRLPIAIGVGHLLARVRVPELVHMRIGRRRFDLLARPLSVLAVAAVGVVAIAPAIVGKLEPQPRLTVEAPWWQRTADWLAAHSAGGRALVIPGSPKPVYLWGATVDDAMQPVARSPWAVRDGVPLAQAAYIRNLDDIERRFAAGRRDDALFQLLVRAGVRYLVVRNDLDATASNATQLAFVHATIANSPGFELAASFGPPAGEVPTSTLIYDAGATVDRPATQIYEVAGWQSRVRLLPENATVRATGSSDELGNLVERGLGADSPVVFGPGLASSVAVVTDGIRRREASFGRSAGSSVTMTADQPLSGARAAPDYLPPDAGPLSTMRYGGGLADVTASSSGAAAGALVNAGPASAPWSAVDADPTTAWKSGALFRVDGQWLQVRLSKPVDTPTVLVAFAPDLGGFPTRVRVETDAGTHIADVSPGPASQPLALPKGSTRVIRIIVLQSTAGTRSVGIRTLAIPGIQPTRTLVVPTVGTPDMFAFDVDAGQRPECLTVNGRAACDPAFAANGEEDNELSRTFSTTQPVSYDLSAGVRLRGGPSLDRALDLGSAIRAAASSVESTDPRERAGAAVDGDVYTSWVADPDDRNPTLWLSLRHPEKISTLRLVTDVGAPVTAPDRVRVRVGRRVMVAPVSPDGLVRLHRPAHGSQLQIQVVHSVLRLSRDTKSGKFRALPLALSEVRINGSANAVVDKPIALDCMSGVTVSLDGRVIPLQLLASRSDVLLGQPVAAFPCGTPQVELAAGEHTVSLVASDLTMPSALTLQRPGTSLAASTAPGSARVAKWGATDRSVVVHTTSDAILAVPENYNDGWQASLHGKPLRAVHVDGWQQGWLVPAASDGTVLLRFAPQRPFVGGLVVGAACVVLLVVLALVSARATAAGVRERAVPEWLWRLLLAGASGLLLGWAGLVVFAVLWRGEPALRRVGVSLPYWSGAALIAVAGFGDAIAWSRSSGGLAGSSWPQLLAAAAVVFAVSRPVTPPMMNVGREYRRSNGRSRK
jgi:arabinofuranan 3-O-arabinosyltransferase